MTKLIISYLDSKSYNEIIEIGHLAEEIRDISDPFSESWYLSLRYIFGCIMWHAKAEGQMNSLVKEAQRIVSNED